MLMAQSRWLSLFLVASRQAEAAVGQSDVEVVYNC